MTNTLHQPENENLDELLEEFILKMTDSDTAEPDASQARPGAADEADLSAQDSFTYQKSIYHHPVVDDLSAYTLIDFALAFQGEKVTSRKRKKHFVLSDTPEQEIRLLLTKYDTLSFGLSSCTPFVFLYREGMPHPLAGIPCPAAESEEVYEQTYCLQTKKPLAAGRYFLYFPGAHCSVPKHGVTDTGTGLCCAFQLLPHGKQLRKPSLNHALLSVEWARNTSPDAWNRGTVQLVADVALPCWETTDTEYALFCFNQDLALMGRPMVCGKLQRSPEFHLKSRKPWMPGVYTAVAICNHEPLAAIVFEISEAGEIEHTRMGELTSDDFFYRYVQVLQSPTPPTDSNPAEMPYSLTDNRCGRDLWETAGLGEEKRKLVRLYRTRQLAERHKVRRPSEVILFTAEEEGTALQTAIHSEHILKTGRQSLVYLDAEQEDRCRALADEVAKELCHNAAIVLYNCHNLIKEANPLLKVMQELSLHSKRGITFVLCLSDTCLGTWQELHPELVGKVAAHKHIHTGRPSMTEQAYSLLQAVHASGMTFSKALQSYLLQSFAGQWEACHLSEWTDYEGWLKQTVEPALRSRTGCQAHASGKSVQVVRADLQLEACWQAQRTRNGVHPQENDLRKKAFEAAMSELNNMVGLQSLKDSLTDLFTLIQFAEQRRKLGLPSSEKVPRYLLFTGNPGTGKTTVARLFGKIYHSLGLLTDGEVVVTERSQLVGEHIGSTEEKTRNVLEASVGKVLFIDEAYTLCDSTRSRVDFGYRVIETLLSTLSEEQTDRVIILAGYKEEMQRLLQANRGLESRFNAHFEFEDYSQEELMQIAENKLASECYRLTPAAREALLQLISEALSHKNPHFGNARWILHRIADGIIPAMARRVMRSGQAADLTLYTAIQEEDVLSAAEAPQLTQQRNHPKIGFSG